MNKKSMQKWVKFYRRYPDKLLGSKLHWWQKLILRYSLKKCSHQYETVSNYYGDYIDTISLSRIYRSKKRCKLCGKEIYSEFLDYNCNVTNDGNYK